MNLAAKLTRLARGFQRQFCLLLVMLLLVALSSCALSTSRVSRDKPRLPDYQIEAFPLRDATWTSDGYELMIGFRISSKERQPWSHVIQEIEHSTTYTFENGQSITTRATLIETFRLNHQKDGSGWVATLPRYQRDRHFESGFLQVAEDVTSVEVTRKVHAYPGVVVDADFTRLGFAHLPKNEDGSFYTLVPKNFNRHYQSRHRTQGEVLWSDRNKREGDYQVHYQWRRFGQLEPVATLSLRFNDSDREISAGGAKETSP